MDLQLKGIKALVTGEQIALVAGEIVSSGELIHIDISVNCAGGSRRISGDAPDE